MMQSNYGGLDHMEVTLSYLVSTTLLGVSVLKLNLIIRSVRERVANTRITRQVLIYTSEN